MNDMRKLMESLQAVLEDSDGPVTYLDQVEIIDYDGGGRARDELSGMTKVGRGDLYRAVINTDSGLLLFVGSQEEAERFVHDLRDNLIIIDGINDDYCEVWPKHRSDQINAWYRGRREDCERFIRGAPVYEAWGDSAADEEEIFFVITDEQRGAALVSMTKDGNRWTENHHEGFEPHGFGSGRYMGYLSATDLRSWLDRDYGRNGDVLGPFDHDEGMQVWQEEVFYPEESLDLEEAPRNTPELDLDLDAENVTQNDDPLHVHYQSRIKASIVRIYRDLGDDNPNAILTLNALRRLSQGKIPMGPQVQSLSALASGLLGLMEDPARVSLLIRALKK